MANAILTDLTRCIGCKACVYACKEINGLPKEEADELNARTWTVVERRGGLNVRRQCMHCLDPACVSVCPVTALQKHSDGPVVYDEDRCMGCRYCMLACPFKVPKYEWDKALPRVQKCIFCFAERLGQGRQPACTEVCPAQATVFGARDELMRAARQRLQAHPGRYVDHIYGVEEAGGTSVLYLSSVPFEQLGFPGGEDSPGKVVFSHETHVETDRPDCAGCHAGGFPILVVERLVRPRIRGEQLHAVDRCGACHDGDKAFSSDDECETCHLEE